jgi:tRNA(adenine34) deaminase
VAGKDGIVAAGARTATRGDRRNEVDHAEIRTLRRLADTSPAIRPDRLCLYATMEPCLMCFGAILLSGIGRLVYAYEDVMGGATRCDRTHMAPLYRDRRIEVVAGIRRRESLDLFKRFFSTPGRRYWKGSLLADYTLNQ